MTGPGGILGETDPGGWPLWLLKSVSAVVNKRPVKESEEGIEGDEVTEEQLRAMLRDQEE